MISHVSRAVLAVLLLSGTAYAELTLADVLSAINRNPIRASAQAAIEKTQADLLAAEGAFDPRVKVSGLAAPVGYYDRYTFDTSLTLPTKVQGITPYAGYRFGDGSFPIYDYKYRTLDRGEARAGVDVPLLQGRSIDSARARLEIAELDMQAARADAAQLALDVSRDAAIAYWDWVAAGHRRRIREAQLAIARDRVAGLRRRVETGDLPRFELTDNARVILQRESALVGADRDVVKAANTLSLYLRDENGRPRPPTLDELPPTLPAGTTTLLETDAIAKALAASPALVANQRRAEAAVTAARAAENLLLPRLDLDAFISKDFGDPEMPEKDIYGPKKETEVGVNLMFELPIGRSAARGAVEAAAATRRRLGFERRLIQDRLGIAVATSVNELTTSVDRARLAIEQATLANELAAAERVRLTTGDGTILIVNLREEASAEAESSVIDSVTEVQRAEARLSALLGRAVTPK